MGAALPMNIRLPDLEKMPVSLPYWHTILDDLGRPPPARLARALGISTRSVYRYTKTGYAPRVVNLALFWLTSWGRATVHTHAHNDAVFALGLVDGLRSEIARLENNVRHLTALSHGASNDPLIRGPHAR